MKGFHRLSLLAGAALVACSSTGGNDGVMPGPSTGNTSTTAGNSSTTGGNAATAGAPTGGAPIGGNGTSGATTGGATTGGATTAGAGAGGTPATGGGGTGGATGGSNPGDDPIAHPLNITAAPALHTHTVNTRQAGVDTRLPKIIGKLIINVDVDDGGIYDYGIKHGFHVWGGKMFHCDIAQAVNTYMSKGRDFNGNCRWETWDGVDHDASAMVTPADSIQGKVKQALTDLAAQFPEEGWAYFLSADGNVRWSDVGITGYSHGASSSIRWAMKTKVWRAVGRSGPRDNICGVAYKGQTCPDTVISSWLDETPATPVANMYGLTGTTDSEYGDIVFAMERLKFPGALVNIQSTAAPYNNSHRLFINGGHDPFTDKAFWPAMDVIWATPAEDIAYANSH